MRTAILLLAVVPAAARADVASWFWTVSDTGNGDGIIQPGESALLTLWAGFEPGATGLSEAGPYAVTGDPVWKVGVIDAYENLLDPEHAFGAGTLDDSTNTISGIHHFQWPPVIGHEFNADNPVAIYSIRWRPDRYFLESVTLGNDAPNAWIYTDDFGTRALYEGVGGARTFSIVPAPMGSAVLAMGAFGLSARRRRGGSAAKISRGRSDPDAFAARVVGDSMTPDYREGDVVIFSPARDVKNGSDCFARIWPDDETTFKRVFFEAGPAGEELIRLQPLNPAYPARVLPREGVVGLFAAVSVMRRIG